MLWRWSGDIYKMSDTSNARLPVSPHEAATMIFLTVVSSSLVMPHAGIPRSVASVLTYPAMVVWSIMLLVGSAVTLVGMFWRGRYITALGIERIGLIAHTTACLTYVLALLSSGTNGNNPWIAAGFVAGIAAANLWKIHRLSLTMKRILFIARRIAEVEGE